MNEATGEYDLRAVDFPVLTGWKLGLVVALLESPARGLLIPKLIRDGGVAWFRKQHFPEAPVDLPTHFASETEIAVSGLASAEWPSSPATQGPGFHFTTAADYARAYREKITTPAEVAERFLQAKADSDRATPPLRAFNAVRDDDVRSQAEASAKRFHAGSPLSVLDGVPMAVKDELDMPPYGTTVGTAFLGKSPAKCDATVVARLRAAGALLIGKANMHEIGIGVTGHNPFHGTPRNPYAPNCHTGGSSSGSAAAVAAGFCPIAVGADGGGSIRIPAALCGVVGLKATFGRISGHGAIPLCPSVAHVGPIGATVHDVALGYAAMAGLDRDFPISVSQPSPSTAGWDNTDLRGVTLGVHRRWFHHAQPEVVTICEGMLERLRSKGASIREIVIPDLEAARVAHAISIICEMNRALNECAPNQRRKHGLDARLTLAIADAITPDDYERAKRARARVRENMRRVFTEVDAIITPATAIAAPCITSIAMNAGISDLSTVTELMRFATPANLTGHPAIAFPAGYTATGLPVALQAIARPWEEALLLRLAATAEGLLERRKPALHYNILDRK